MEDKFWSKVEKTEGCWIWKGRKTERGYGHFYIGGKIVRSHRLAYELIKGPIPEGKELDHLCRNHSCVNPNHLEAVTHKENMLRGNDFAATNSKKKVCPKGHPLEGDNLVQWLLEYRGVRMCRTCANDKTRKYQRDKYRREHLGIKWRKPDL